MQHRLFQHSPLNDDESFIAHDAHRSAGGPRKYCAVGPKPASTLQGSFTARRITMRLPSARRNLGLGISLLLLAASTLAQNNPQKTNAPNNPAQKPVHKPAQQKAPLAENENPELIGKRNINKLQINFYSFDKEVAIGRQFAQEVDHSAKLVEDPIIVEYINK